MELTILHEKNRSILQVDDARIVYRNFEGRPGPYNREGDRSFSLVIPNEEIRNALLADENEFGASWNLKIKPPRDDGDEPFVTLPVKVRYNGTNRDPNVYLVSGDSMVRLTEETVGKLDSVDILRVDLDINSSDNIVNGRPYRAAYLKAIKVVQDIDRFGLEFAEMEHPEE